MSDNAEAVHGRKSSITFTPPIPRAEGSALIRGILDSGVRVDGFLHASFGVATQAELRRIAETLEIAEAWDSLAPAPAPASERGGGAWHSADSAPRDGSHILVAQFGEGTGFGRCGGVDQPWQAVVHYWANPGEEGFYLSSGDSGGQPVAFTHWLPLDLSPERAGPDAMREALEEVLLLGHRVRDRLIDGGWYVGREWPNAGQAAWTDMGGHSSLKENLYRLLDALAALEGEVPR